MRTGASQNPDDVVAHALDLLNSADEFLADEQGAVEAKIERAFAQFERGKFFSAEESRERATRSRLRLRTTLSEYGAASPKTVLNSPTELKVSSIRCSNRWRGCRGKDILVKLSQNAPFSSFLFIPS
jgi:hypothetical protein